jgi:ssDNA-binding Zn-finger/Zn-ribbon topoisomerase 1
MPDPIELTSIPLPFDSPYVIKTGRIQGRVPYPYLLRNDDFKIGLPPEITIEEITKELIADLEKKQEASLSKERIICECPECGTSIYIKLGPNGSFYIQHGVKEKGVRQDKCIYKNMIGPIFEDEDPDNLTSDEAIERFSLSAKNPRHIVSENGWDYMTAVGPYGGYSMKQRTRQVFDNDELKTLKKDEIFELIEEEKSQRILKILDNENKKIPKSATKEKIIDSISEVFKIVEKTIKKLSKDELVELSKLLEIVLYRGRFRMKAEDATKDNLINKIVIEKKNKPLESPRDALTISPEEILSLFGDIREKS